MRSTAVQDFANWSICPKCSMELVELDVSHDKAMARALAEAIANESEECSLYSRSPVVRRIRLHRKLVAAIKERKTLNTSSDYFLPF